MLGKAIAVVVLVFSVDIDRCECGSGCDCDEITNGYTPIPFIGDKGASACSTCLPGMDRQCKC